MGYCIAWTPLIKTVYLCLVNYNSLDYALKSDTIRRFPSIEEALSHINDPHMKYYNNKKYMVHEKDIKIYLYDELLIINIINN